MRHSVVASVAGPAAVVLILFYYFIPFLIVAGAPDYFARLRPFVIAGALLMMAAGLRWSWPGEGAEERHSAWKVMVLGVSAIMVLILLLFPQTVANFLASAFGGLR
jgi:TctA family transporter